MSDRCPACRHNWTAHTGRNGGQKCNWHMGPTGCPCRVKNPQVEAEDRLAAAAWNLWMGRK